MVPAVPPDLRALARLAVAALQHAEALQAGHGVARAASAIELRRAARAYLAHVEALG